jgi:hypothetical protein
MSLPDVNQLVLAILSGAGSRHATLRIKKGTKTCVSSREQRYKPLRMGLPRAGSHWLSKPRRGPTASSRAMRVADGRATSSGRAPATEGPSRDARARGPRAACVERHGRALDGRARHHAPGLRAAPQTPWPCVRQATPDTARHVGAPRPRQPSSRPRAASTGRRDGRAGCHRGQAQASALAASRGEGGPRWGGTRPRAEAGGRAGEGKGKRVRAAPGRGTPWSGERARGSRAGGHRGCAGPGPRREGTGWACRAEARGGGEHARQAGRGTPSRGKKGARKGGRRGTGAHCGRSKGGAGEQRRGRLRSSGRGVGERCAGERGPRVVGVKGERERVFLGGGG